MLAAIRWFFEPVGPRNGFESGVHKLQSFGYNRTKIKLNRLKQSIWHVKILLFPCLIRIQFKYFTFRIYYKNFVFLPNFKGDHKAYGYRYISISLCKRLTVFGKRVEKMRKYGMYLFILFLRFTGEKWGCFKIKGGL